MGISLDKANGLVGMMQGESGQNLNPRGEHWDVNGPSGGTAQWHDIAGRGGRLSQLKQFAAKMGRSWQERDVQQQFFKHETENGYAGVWRRIEAARSGAEALAAGVAGFENPRDHAGEIRRRMPNYNRLSAMGAPEAGSGSSSRAYPQDWRRAARDYTGMNIGGGFLGGAQVNPEGSVTVNLHNFNPGVKVNTQSDGFFKSTKVNRGRTMAMPAEEV